MYLLHTHCETDVPTLSLVQVFILQIKNSQAAFVNPTLLPTKNALTIFIVVANIIGSIGLTQSNLGLTENLV